MPAGRSFPMIVAAFFATVLAAFGQSASSVSATGAMAALKKRESATALPQSKAPSMVSSMPPSLPSQMPRLGYARYPWKLDIVATVFWVGEQPTENNPTPNDKSSWDTKWMENFGGYDDPDPTKRSEAFTPIGFMPKQNPFYIALPYNDVIDYNSHKPEASKIIPWFKQRFRGLHHEHSTID